MARSHSNREAFYFYNNLTGMVKSLENKYTTIDLKNEACVTGKIVLVDGYMNIDLEDALFYDPRGTEIPFETIFIRARQIRYVHIPLDVCIIDSLKDMGWMRPTQEHKSQKTRRTFKTKRAIVGHQKTLQELSANQSKE
ncbi:Lsm10 [Carabus blaptoides fortunei]